LLRNNWDRRLLSTVVIIIVLLRGTLICSWNSWSIALIVITTIVEVLRSVVIAAVVERHATVELPLNEEEDLLNEIDGVRSLKKVRVKLVGGKLLSLIVEVSLVLGLGLLPLADLRELVVGNIKRLTIEKLAVKAHACVSCHIWLLKAHESAG
jgi:hypothetical protein